MEQEKVPNIQDPTQDLKRNHSRKIPGVLIAQVMILNQNLKVELISRIKVKATKENLLENLKEEEKASILETSMKEAA